MRTLAFVLIVLTFLFGYFDRRARMAKRSQHVRILPFECEEASSCTDPRGIL